MELFSRLQLDSELACLRVSVVLQWLRCDLRSQCNQCLPCFVFFCLPFLFLLVLPWANLLSRSSSTTTITMVTSSLPLTRPTMIPSLFSCASCARCSSTCYSCHSFVPCDCFRVASNGSSVLLSTIHCVSGMCGSRSRGFHQKNFISLVIMCATLYESYDVCVLARTSFIALHARTQLRRSFWFDFNDGGVSHFIGEAASDCLSSCTVMSSHSSVSPLDDTSNGAEYMPLIG